MPVVNNPPVWIGNNDGVSGTPWPVYGTTGWIEEGVPEAGLLTGGGPSNFDTYNYGLYDLGAHIRIGSYAFDASYGSGLLWFFWGSTNGETWDLLASGGPASTLSINNPISPAKAYWYYQLQLVVNTGSPD